MPASITAIDYPKSSSWQVGHFGPEQGAIFTGIRKSEQLKEEERRRIESRPKETTESSLGMNRKIGKDHR